MQKTDLIQKIKAKTGGKIKIVISGASTLAKHISYFFNGINIPIIEGYGLTETSPIVSVNPKEKNKIGTVGTPLEKLEVKLAEDNELLVKGPNVMMGYFKDKKATQETITPDGWLKTGDICNIDDENFITVIERKKDLFKSTGGKYIVPQKIENLAKINEYIEEFVVIAENRKFASAIIMPDFESLKKYAKSNNIKYDTIEDLIENSNILSLFREVINEEINTKLAPYETIRKFILIDTPFTIQNGLLTPSLKIKRKEVNKVYKDKISQLYGE